ncbi:type II secretion system F family protein [Candidatus Uhrbacteria bacterium]|nr:type II secretion system F family protein [Candidatus Uhrbacteria bacterium]
MLSIKRRVPLPTKIFLLDHLRVMLRAGLPIGRALESLAADVERPAIGRMLGEVKSAIERGGSLADALAAHPTLFPPLAVELIRAGEHAGTLEATLTEVATQLRKDHELRSRVQGALLYPAVIVGAMVVIGTGIIIFVLPKLLNLFRDVTVALPLPTRLLLGFSTFMGAYGWIVAIVLVALAIACVAFVRSARGKILWHRLLVRFPGRMGVLIREVNIARILRTLSGLLHTDIPIVRALELTTATLGNVQYRATLRDASTRIARGESLGAILRERKDLFPPTAVQVVAVGEETGSLDELLGELANFYEADVERTLRNLTTIIEPILILTIGVGVAFLAIAVLMPMYSIAQAV